MYLAVSELGPDEVAQAFILVQKGQSPNDIIHALRGEKAEPIDPDQFSRDVQRRCQELGVLPRLDDTVDESDT